MYHLNDTDIEAEMKKALIFKDPTAPPMYFLPKIHKDGSPGRPIVSGCSCPKVQISRFLEMSLRPRAQITPSYIKDTTDFIKHIDFLNSTLSPLFSESLLVSADVCSLYTNINHADGLSACRLALDSRSVKEPPTDQLIRLPELVLTLNNFEFDSFHYLQIRGTAMGSVCAPSYAIIFMSHLEERMLNAAVIRPVSWKRYIDDIFFFGLNLKKIFVNSKIT